MSGLTIAVARRRLAKMIHADATIEPYDSAKTFDFHQTEVADLDALHDLLKQLASQPSCAVIRGGIVDPQRATRVRRLLYEDQSTGEQATLRDVARDWLALDIDGVPLPRWIRPQNLIGCGLVAIRTLPTEFRGVGCIVQATGSHRLKPGVHLRLWYWLSRGVTCAEAKIWLRASPIDPALFTPHQTIYTASPIFLPGAFDPLPARIDVVRGTELVEVPPPKRPKKQRRGPPSDYDKKTTGDWLGGLIRKVESARFGNRNALLYWAARRLAEHHGGETDIAALGAAAIRTGLSAIEVDETIKSGVRHG